MKNLEPLLFRFKKETVSPSRVGINEANDYDHYLDMMMIIEDGKRLPAIDAQRPRRTKKADMEKGEDQKDSLMWRWSNR